MAVDDDYPAGSLGPGQTQVSRDRYCLKPHVCIILNTRVGFRDRKSGFSGFGIIGIFNFRDYRDSGFSGFGFFGIFGIRDYRDSKKSGFSGSNA